MSYCPESLIAELQSYQDAAEAAFLDGVIVHEDFHPYGSTTAKETRQEGPDYFTIETIDDILPLSIYLHELTYRLCSVDGDKATYRYWG